MHQTKRMVQSVEPAFTSTQRGAASLRSLLSTLLLPRIRSSLALLPRQRQSNRRAFLLQMRRSIGQKVHLVLQHRHLLLQVRNHALPLPIRFLSAHFAESLVEREHADAQNHEHQPGLENVRVSLQRGDLQLQFLQLQLLQIELVVSRAGLRGHVLDLRWRIERRTHFFFHGRNARLHLGEFFFGSVVKNGDGVDEIGLFFFGSLVY